MCHRRRACAIADRTCAHRCNQFLRFPKRKKHGEFSHPFPTSFFSLPRVIQLSPSPAVCRSMFPRLRATCIAKKIRGTNFFRPGKPRYTFPNFRPFSRLSPRLPLSDLSLPSGPRLLFQVPQTQGLMDREKNLRIGLSEVDIHTKKTHPLFPLL